MLHVSLSRRLARGVSACLVALFFAAALFAQNPAALDGFEPDFDGNVYAVAVQADGKILVGGQFAYYRTREGFFIGRNNLARLNADGSLDEAFNPSPNGAVRAIALQPDGAILVGGEFSTFQPGGAGTPVARNGFARLSAAGALDALSLTIAGAALPGGSTLRAAVYAIAVQPDNAIVIGGSFATVQPGLLTVIFTRNNLFRLTPTGAIDPAFDPNPNGAVLALASHVDGKLVVAGGFTSFREAQRTSATTRNRIARLNRDGTLDPEFNPSANNAVDALAVQRDGKIVLAGHFTTLQPPTDSGPASRNQIARLNVDGTLDSEFYPGANGAVTALGIQPDGSIVIGGAFTAAWGRGAAAAGRGNVARFHPDGSLDAFFNPNFNAPVSAMAFQADGKVVLGGLFTRALPPGASQAVVRNRLARVNADGTLDATFQLAAGGRVLSAVQQSDGRIIIGGSFSSVGGATHNFLARLNADGAVDATYTPSLNGPVYATALESGGKLLIGGAFTTITHPRTGTETRSRIARLNPDGTPDSEFNPNIDGQVTAIVVQPDGKILVGGTFSTVRPIGATETTTRSHILRLNANGTLDTAFNPTPNSPVAALALQSDGKIVLGGSFTAFAANGATTPTLRNYVARLNADGTVDTAFDPAIVSTSVSAVAVQSDGKVIIGGRFTTVTPRTATEFTTRNRIARLNADGTLDTTYNPNANNLVLAIALQPDGKAIIGGDFTTLQPNGATTPTLRQYTARLNADGTVDASYFLDLNEVAGNRVDLVRLLANNQALIGGRFNSLETPGLGTRVVRPDLVRINIAGANATLDAGFNPGAGGAAAGTINALALQADHKVIAVGSFTDVGGARTTNIARYNPEGGADPSFGATLTTDGPVHAVVVRPVNTLVSSTLGGFAWLNAGGSLRSGFTASANARINGRVHTAVVDSGGRLLVGGAFSNLSNATGGNLARFLPNGTLDVAFNPNPNGVVTGLVVQPDGKIVIAGAFNTVHGVARNNIARLNDDGTLDNAFDPNASSRINALVRDNDGRLIVGGAFTTFSPNGATTPVTRNYLARLNADGTLDSTYNPNPNGAVNALALQSSDGKIVAGGAFTSVQTNATGTALTRNFAARFNPDGSLDQNFDPNPNAAVLAVAAAADGKFVLGGAFTALTPNISGAAQPAATRNNLVRVNSDGRVDDTFDPSPNGAVTSVAVQPDGSVVLAGLFTTLQPAGAATAVARNHLARVSSAGAVDVNFNPDVNGDVGFVAVRPDTTLLVGGSFTDLQASGSIIVGGNFAMIGGIAAANLAALNNNGSVNSGFQPRPNGAVNALLLQPDGKLVVGGAFTSIAGAARDRIARFNDDGTLDAIFAPSVGATITALALQSDGRILAGGSTGGSGGGVLVRINSSGAVDQTFASGNVLLGVAALAVQADNKILAVLEGSGFRHTLVRLNENGGGDPTFTPLQNASGFFDALAVQADGRILVGGEFTALGGANVARLARLNANGTVDASFNPAPNGRVTALALQADGRAVLGGNFTAVSGQPRVGLARVSTGGAATQALVVSADRRTVTWVRGGTTTELAAVTFERSSDRIEWVPAGGSMRVAGTANWQLLARLQLPTDGVFYIRARGVAPSDGASSGVVELVREFNFANPLGGPSSSTALSFEIAASLPGQNAALWTIDPLSGIGALTAVQTTTTAGTSQSSVEIMVAAATGPVANGAAWLSNLSTRGRVSATSPLVVGFAIAGTGSRTVLVRGIGPALATFGVGDAATATRLEVLDAAGRTVIDATGWDAAAGAETLGAFARTGAFPLPTRSGDSAALLTLSPGTYTLQVAAAQGSGTALAEIYDADSSATSRLMNLSTRGTAASGSGALIGGFVVSGNLSKRVLLRGAGPALTKFGLTGTLADPAIGLFDAQGVQLGANDNWASIAPQVVAAATSVGAFAFDAESRDAGVLATLPPGAYTVQLTPAASAAAQASGLALLEIYELP